MVEGLSGCAATSIHIMIETSDNGPSLGRYIFRWLHISVWHTACAVNGLQGRPACGAGAEI